MKAAICTRYGSPDVLEIRDTVKPEPKSGEVLVRVRATTVNRTDCGMLRAHPFISRIVTGILAPKRQILGMDFAGEVEAIGAGVIVATGGIAPTAMGAKISLSNGQYTVVDGPFTETKELIGGWALMECRDLAEAIEWTKRFLGVFGEGEVRVRPVFGPE